MARYKILFRDSVAKDLSGLPKNDVRRILDKIEKLGTEPRPQGCEKLSGDEKYRVRQGNYRIIYSIQDGELTVWVVKVGHRKDVCRH